MKYLCGHSSTRQALERWSGHKGLIIASVYIWHAGTELQKSQNGLLQSVLYEIFCQCPELIPIVLPRRWEDCARTNAPPEHWTRSELINAFNEISKLSTLSKKMYFFIDGLDEYEGYHREVINLVQSFAKSEDVKLCSSSRLRNLFEKAFGNNFMMKLQLEVLTRNDIELYVHSKLVKDQLFSQLRAREEERCDKLVSEVVDKANGVFLWVFLIVRSLLQGLTNADRIVDLQRRLRYLPADLETYFEHTLGTLEDFYK